MCEKTAKKSSNPEGFTLIELMIVVAIIAIISAIGIPSLIRSRMAANETSAVASLRMLVTAQTMYHTTNVQYADRLSNLYNFELIDSSILEADGTTGTASSTAKSGYYLASNTNYSMNGFMFMNAPANYNTSGIFTYFVNAAGAPYKVNMASDTATIIDAYDDANDWDSNVGNWMAAQD
ncbi:MAG: type II secretion system protein [Planctomycetota bacterium]